jgi:lysozyme
MKTSPAGIALICRFEGCKLEAYWDIAKPPVITIGYGHTGAGVSAGQTITQARAEQLLAADLLTFECAVTSAVCVPLTQGQFDALVAWTFNVKGWRTSMLLKLVNLGRFAAASNEFCHWNHAGGIVIPGLTKRREAERDLFLETAA